MNTLKKNKKVILGLSGGVDSTTAALLLKEQGMEVIGFYFDVLGTNREGEEAARKLAERLSIDFVSMDVSKQFSEIVIENFCNEYACGRTPNPCVICNPTIKFRKLLQIADERGAYYIATGHYAQVEQDPVNGLYYITKGVNQKKDQSYMLYRLGQDVLSRLLLPLGGIACKEDTRRIARSYELPNAEASDSQEICFIDESVESYERFLFHRNAVGKKGNFIDQHGNVLGEHRGISCYTVGQRKGLGIALGKPAFVTKIDAESGDITLGDNDSLFRGEVYSYNNFFAETSGSGFPDTCSNKLSVSAKIRYAAKAADAVVEKISNGRLLTTFDEPQRAPTPGQSIVFYQGDRVIGGGFIE